MEKYISIIIPCYNVESYIDRCFQSLLAQTIGFDKLEIILVDDCSTDHTWDKLTAIEAAYPESVMIIHCDENGHQGRARNIGLQYASAPYIGYVDSDDWIEPDMYEKLYEKIVTYDCDLTMCQNWRDTAVPGQVLAPKLTGQSNRMFEIDTQEKRGTFLVCGSIGYGVWDKLFKRDFLIDNQIFFPEGLAYEDHFFSTLLYLYASKVYILEERLYHYYVNPASTVLSPNAAHHFDILTIDMMMWEECANRGFLDNYRKELEYQFLTLCYLAAIKMISLRLTKVPYDFFLRLKEETLKRIPNYHENPYVKDYVTEFNQTLLQLLDFPISESDLAAVCKAVVKKHAKGVLQIYVMTHVNFSAPDDPIYHPLHVGRALKGDLGYPGDDTGDNISHLNLYYSELTGLYWAWKNIRNTEYIGLCHYRRYFLNENHSIMTKADFLPILEKYNVIISQPVFSEKCYRDSYAEAHTIHDLEAVSEAIATLYPDCMPIFQDVLSGRKLYCGNLFVTTKELFDDYAQWLFSIFELASKQIDVSTYDDYHKRVYGFLSEQLLFVWVLYRNLTWCEVPIGFTQEKAETLTLKEQLSSLFAEKKIEEAHTLFLNTMKVRPDVMLSGSDFHQELTTILRIIHICEEERKQDCPSFLNYTTDLRKLTAHYNRIAEILNKCADSTPFNADFDYLKHTAVSSCAIDIMIPIIGKGEKRNEICTILRSNGIL
ncbi:MAG: DUF4422 domain-containing protein [Lachnospiraceae bacterium]|nr:DUF4422 domain-containing protein [Lachnospiraceae bacterium]